jgi:putative transposase
MKKRFSVEQIVAVLKQAELGLSVADLTRRIDISEQTFYRWKKQYAGLETDQVREFKQLTDENARLKKLVAEAQPEQSGSAGRAVKKVPRPALMKEVVAYVASRHSYSERRACALTCQHRSTRRKPGTRDPRLEIRQRMREIAATRIRYGYRRVHIMLRRDGWTVGRNLIWRLYREEALALREPNGRGGARWRCTGKRGVCRSV